MLKTFLGIACVISAGSVSAVEPLSSGELALKLRKLDTLASVLYVAAHPDDENTRLIAYFANGALAKTTYLSLTRGDGGQNLLGPDLGETLGMIRTQELLAARRIDGGEQRFTRAVDFGYSKTAEESIELWGHEEILADLVWTIRSVRPDVIITRFSPEPTFPTHGHHTASAQLAREAFHAAGDPARFPEQLEWVEPWEATRLLWDTFSWPGSGGGESDPAGQPGVDVGAYNTLLGESYPEIAARSRSEHKTQGFGATAVLGSSIESFSHLDGSPAESGVFCGIDTTWGRVNGSENVAAAIDLAIANHSPETPWTIVSHLIEAHRELAGLPEGFWRARKLKELEQAIASCIGLDIESVANRRSATPGDEVELSLRAIHRAPLGVQLDTDFGDGASGAAETRELRPNIPETVGRTIRIPPDAEPSQPYWLREPHPPGRYHVGDLRRIGDPENPADITVDAIVYVDGYPLRFTVPAEYQYNDPVHGEVKERFLITPPAMINLSESIHIVSDSDPREIRARIVVPGGNQRGIVHLDATGGWTVQPAEIPFTADAGDEFEVRASIAPPAEPGEGMLRASVELNGTLHNRGLVRISYPHIPDQTLFPVAEARLVLLDVKTAGRNIGYISGAGDGIPEALRRMGYVVEHLSEADMDPGSIARFDAVVLGIRALNTVDRIDSYMPALFDYAEQGGVIILQYNTNFQLNTRQIAPVPLTLSRVRVADQDAEMRIVAPNHPVLTFPNRIGPADFENWVQERGLYFASSWHEEFQPIFSVNDENEPPAEGGLLVARHGEGWYIYTGLSWFRQLPAGVPGAYRLFANLVSLGHAE